MSDLLFRLDVIEDDDTWVIVGDCPQGRKFAHVPAPFTDAELQSRLAGVELALVRSTSQLVTRRASRAELDFGRTLSKVLLPGDIRILFALCREKAREQRVSMRILLNPVGPHVCQVPWEFTVDPDADDDYLALRLAVVRSPNLMERVEPLLIEPPLRVLAVMSRPRDLPQLEADQERQNISAALGGVSSDLLHIEWMDGDRWQDLRSKLKAEPFHILHFIGHGGFDEDTQSGYIELTDDKGEALRVQAGDLARFVQDNPYLKLVVLNACESATTGEDGVFSSTAAKLMRAGIPAVVAMQYEITDPAAIAFSFSFYEAIAHGLPLDQAVTRARQDVKILTGSLEWATPVLFLASPETQIFAVPQSAVEAPTVGTPDVPKPRVPESEVPIPQPRAPSEALATASTTGTAAGASPEQGDWSGQVRSRITQFMNRMTTEAPTTVRSAGSPAAPASSPAQPMRPPVPRPRSSGLQQVWTSPALGSCTHFSLGPNDLAALACPDGVRVVSLTTRAEMARCSLPRADHAQQIAWSPWPRHLACLYASGAVVVWELGSETPVHVLRARTGRATQVAFSHDGRWLSVAADDRTVHVFNAQGAEVRAFAVPPAQGGDADWRPPLQAVTALAFTPDDRHLLIGADDGSARQYDVHGRLVRAWWHTHPVTALAASAASLATGSLDGKVRTWTWDGVVVRRLSGALAHFADWSRDGGQLAVVGNAGCQVWDASGAVRGRAELGSRGVGLGFMSTGTVVTATDAGTIQGWSVQGASEGVRDD